MLLAPSQPTTYAAADVVAVGRAATTTPSSSCVEGGDLDAAAELDGRQLAGPPVEQGLERGLVEHRRLGPARRARRPTRPKRSSVVPAALRHS